MDPKPLPPMDGKLFLAWWDDDLSKPGKRTRFHLSSRFFVDGRWSPVEDPTHWAPLPAKLPTT